MTLITTEGFIGTIAGLNGGIISVYVSQPMDTIKVKMQTFPEIHKNSLTCIKNTWNQHGLFRGFYAGSLPALCGSVCENVVLFTAVPFCQKFVATVCNQENAKELSCFQHAVAGSCCGFFTSLVMCPNELIKCKIQSQKEIAQSNKTTAIPGKHGPTSVIKHIFKTEGLLGFYRGYSCTLARELPGLFCYIGGNETARYLLTPKGKRKEDLSPLSTAVAGGFGGACLWTAIFPLDVVKSRIQVGRLPTALQVSKCDDFALGCFWAFRPLFVTTLIHIIRTEGIRALYLGIAPTLLRTIPATATLFVVVEETRKIGFALTGA